MDYDALIVGAGIAGMQSALTLGDMGFRVLLVEKEPSIGGRMILLSKVFPTLDCASCISAPKMAATAHHPNVTLMTSAEVDGIERSADGGFVARVRKKATFVDPAACTGCSDCERACTVAIADRFNCVSGRESRDPHRIPPGDAEEGGDRQRGQLALLVQLPGRRPGARLRLAGALRSLRRRVPSAPRRRAAAGRAGPRLLRAVRGSSARAERPRATIGIRAIKRFMTDYYYDRHPEPEYGVPAERNGKRVAIVGSGPAGLGAAYFLAQTRIRGHDLRGRRRGGRHAALRHPSLSPAARRARSRSEEHHRARRRDP